MKKNLLRLFTVILLFTAQACDYTPNRSNIIAASRSLIDTGRRYMIIQRDTSHPAIAEKKDSVLAKKPDTLAITQKQDTALAVKQKPVEKPVAVASSKADSLVNYAKSLVGKPYVYGANTPEKGFDNSGFVNFVFNHFGVKVPKYAPSFIAVGENVTATEVSEGDIVLFSKTDSVKKVVYQVGIVVSAKGSPVSFIHASSGKMNGVGISNMSSYYQRKVIGFRRVF